MDNTSFNFCNIKFYNNLNPKWKNSSFYQVNMAESLFMGYFCGADE